MRLSKKRVIKYLQRKMREIDNGDFWEFQTQWNDIKRCIQALEEIR